MDGPPKSEAKSREHEILRSSKLPVELLSKLTVRDGLSFRNIIEKNKIYVDKSKFILELLKMEEKYFVFTRPRRFGKSLFIDTLECFFLGEKKLFADTLLYKELPNYDWCKYPVLRLNFSSYVADTRIEIERKVVCMINEKARELKISLDSREFPICLIELISKMKKRCGLNVVVLIDEYDAVINKCRIPNQVMEVSTFFISFFACLKEEFKNIHLCFVTGITMVALSSFFSGFNNFTSLNSKPEFSETCGFTINELENYFDDYISYIANCRGISRTNIWEEMTRWFGGFKFTTQGKEIFNPCAIILYFASIGRQTEFFSKSGDSNYIYTQIPRFQDLSIQLTVDIVGTYTAPKDMTVLESYEDLDLFGEFTLADNSDQTWIVLLFQTGILTILNSFELNGKLRHRLKFTNMETERFYRRAVSNKIIKGNDRFKPIMSKVKMALRSENWPKLVRYLNSYFCSFPYTLLVCARSSEAVLQVLLYMLLKNVCDDAELEYSVTQGRVDIVSWTSVGTHLYELKMENNSDDAIAQCQKYVPAFLNNGVPVICFAIKFSRKVKAITKFDIVKFSPCGTSKDVDEVVYTPI